MFLVNTGVLGVNTWVVPLADNYVLIVDPAACDFSRDRNKIIDFLENKKLVPVGIFLTHGHFDHIMGTGVLKERYPNVKLAVHKDDICLIGKRACESQSDMFYSRAVPGFSEGLSNLPDADVLFDDAELLSSVFDNVCDEVKDSLAEWKVIHTPGHTKGSVCLYNNKKKILISGDTVFYHGYGRTDFPGGSDIEMQQSLLKLSEEIPMDTKVFPGHDIYGFMLEENQ